MKIEPLKSEQDYDEALAEIDKIFDADIDTPEGDRLDALATLVEAYEAKHWPIGDPEPVSPAQPHRQGWEDMAEAQR